MKSVLFFCIGMMIGYSAKSQATLEEYIMLGFDNNQSIRQQYFEYDKSTLALKEAKTLFLPTVQLMSDYFLAGGGRTVDFPAGDLLNPVYGTLNQLTNTNNFPQLENQRILLNPNNFYDVKIRTSAPIINPDIRYNRNIKKEQLELQRLQVDLYKRELAKEIKIAYFNYLKSTQAIEIYKSALAILNESKRINESLYQNDKVNRTVVIRAENEITKFTTLVDIATQKSQTAKAYFNFLLNRNLDENINVDPQYNSAATTLGNLNGVSQREELQQLRIAEEITRQGLGLTQTYKTPKLNAFLDLGSQGFDGTVNRNSAYYFFGLSLQWDLFTAGRNKLKSQQAQVDIDISQSKTTYVGQQLQLQYTTSIHRLTEAISEYEAALSNYKTSQKYYTDILKLYKEGQVLFIELLDAQNQLIQTELQVNIALFETHIKAAEIERADTSFNLNK